MESVIGMKRFDGYDKSPLWLLGDSNPKAWETKLKVPFDSRHPIRHNIWTAVYDVIQRHVYHINRHRVSDDALYIRNAISDSGQKPKRNLQRWLEPVNLEVQELNKLIKSRTPRMIITFGSFSFEFARRAYGDFPHHPYGYWDTKRLGNEFRLRIEGESETIILPLLHRSIAGGNFLSGHRNFCPENRSNYFEYAGQKIAQILLTRINHEQLWVQ